MNIEYELGKTKYMLVDEKIVFLTVEQDDCSPSPLEDFDGFGSIYSFNRWHRNHWQTNSLLLTDIKHDICNEFGKDFAMLGYFKHGRCIWHVAGNIPPGTSGDYRWDGVALAGFWVPDDCLKEDLACTDVDKKNSRIAELASQACEIYTSWCNGDVYWFSIEVFTVKHSENGMLYDTLLDYRNDDSIYCDCCGGFYDFQHMIAVMEESLKGIE